MLTVELINNQELIAMVISWENIINVQFVCEQWASYGNCRQSIQAKLLNISMKSSRCVCCERCMSEEEEERQRSEGKKAGMYKVNIDCSVNAQHECCYVNNGMRVRERVCVRSAK